MEKDCIFCKIVKGEIPSKKEYEDYDLVVFHDIHPLAPVHVLIVPRKHIPRLSETADSDRELLGKILIVAKTVASKLGISDAFRVTVANGEGAGQSVPHMHFHLTGGWKKKYNGGEDET
jgi:histidine triad (HIT) family protein